MLCPERPRAAQRPGRPGRPAGTARPGTAKVVWRAGLGVFALAGVVAGFEERRPSLDTVDFLSYFTTLSNLIGAAALLAGALPGLHGRPRVDWLRGAAALYLAITGLVYALLMGGDAGTWTGWAQHRVMPVAVPLDWLLFATAHDFPARRTVLGWLAFPLAYLGYTLAHGVATSWYPYPYLNTAEYGFGPFTSYTSAIAVLFVVLAGLLAAWPALHRRTIVVNKRSRLNGGGGPAGGRRRRRRGR
ncbi:Pr6Pr family membrane protein [Actinomadura sp. NTSP31]|uniref:Pr6Pr family membrane protein n=1 Tax=Actinomadura sp. NTSP31 TaxID=1735447 RepID=UPI0035C1706B